MEKTTYGATLFYSPSDLEYRLALPKHTSDSEAKEIITAMKPVNAYKSTRGFIVLTFPKTGQ